MNFLIAQGLLDPKILYGPLLNAGLGVNNAVSLLRLPAGGDGWEEPELPQQICSATELAAFIGNDRPQMFILAWGGLSMAMSSPRGRVVACRGEVRPSVYVELAASFDESALHALRSQSEVIARWYDDQELIWRFMGGNLSARERVQLSNELSLGPDNEVCLKEALAGRTQGRSFVEERASLFDESNFSGIFINTRTPIAHVLVAGDHTVAQGKIGKSGSIIASSTKVVRALVGSSTQTIMSNEGRAHVISLVA